MFEPYTKNRLVSKPNDKENQYGANIIGINSIEFIKIKKKMTFIPYIYIYIYISLYWAKKSGLKSSLAHHNFLK